MKTILSWDVGIKNLAYCLLQKDDADNSFKILKWGVINLNDNQQKCQFELRTGNACQEVAKYCVYHKDKVSLFDENENGMAFVCTKHKTKMIPEIVNVVDLAKSKKTKIGQQNQITLNKELKCCCDCDDDVVYQLGDTKYCWCEKHYDKKGISFMKKVHAKKVTVTTCSKQPIQELAETLFLRLDVLFKSFGEISEVLIENQPTLKNPKMKTLSSILFSYFVIRGITDKNITGSNISEVRFVSPSNKLKVNSTNTDELLKKEKEKTADLEKNKKNVYKLTKSLGVKYCKALICESDAKILEQVKKKDDMCDAFLQGFQYLFSPMPEKFFKKLETIGFTDVTVKKGDKNKTDECEINEEYDNDCDEDEDEKPKKVKKSNKSKDKDEDEKPKKVKKSNK